MDKLQALPTRPRPKNEFVDSEEVIGEKLFLYDETTEDVHTLSSGAALVWLLCDGERDVESIVREIGSYFELSDSDALAHVQRAISLFQEQGFLEP